MNINSFPFNNVYYIQNLGTGMGTKMAPIYATLTLAYLEENRYEIIGKIYNIKGEFTWSWKRYLDDCFIFWKFPWGNINELHNLLQNLHPKIKLTFEHSFKELPFLHILTKTKMAKSSQISTTNPQTPNNTCTSNSHHSKNCIKIHPLHSIT